MEQQSPVQESKKSRFTIGVFDVFALLALAVLAYFLLSVGGKESVPVSKKVRQNDFQLTSEEFASLRQATPDDYKTFLAKYLVNGGKITHYYDYDLPDDFFTADHDFTLKRPHYGSESGNVIALPGVKVISPNGLGHCNVFYQSEGKVTDDWWVPCYRNTVPPNVQKQYDDALKAEWAASKKRAQEREQEAAKMETAKERMLSNLRPASRADYEKWLHGYLNKGGKVSHEYDYSFSQIKDEFYVATNDFNAEPLFGSSAISVIVPRGIKVGGLNLFTHCNYYFLDDYRVEPDGKLGLGFVPIYSDIHK